MRIVTRSADGQQELKGKLKFSNMIPVPDDMIEYYDISTESDDNYKIMVEKEYEFIRCNSGRIIRNTNVIYNQKTKENELFTDGNKPGYLNATIDFTYAEKIHDMYVEENKYNQN